MTLVSLMKDDDNPRIQIAAAKALLSRHAPENVLPEPLDAALSDDDIDHAIAVAKALLDELAARKAASLPGPGEMGDGGAPAATDAGG